MEKIMDLAGRIDSFAWGVDPYEYRDVYENAGDGVAELVSALTTGGATLQGIVDWLSWYLDDDDVRPAVIGLLDEIRAVRG